MIWNLLSAFMAKRRMRLRKAEGRSERRETQDRLLDGQESLIRDETMRRLAQAFGLPAEELVADAARRGEDAAIAALNARLGEEAEVQRTWGQTRGQVRSDFLRRLRPDA